MTNTESLLLFPISDLGTNYQHELPYSQKKKVMLAPLSCNLELTCLHLFGFNHT